MSHCQLRVSLIVVGMVVQTVHGFQVVFEVFDTLSISPYSR